MSRARKRYARKAMQGKKTPFIEINLAEQPQPIPDGMTRAFKNNYYVAMIYENTVMENGIVATKMMVQAHDDKPIKNHWRELQLIKTEVFGDDVTAVEYYPATDRVIDNFNIYWLWIIPNQPLAINQPNKTRS